MASPLIVSAQLAQPAQDLLDRLRSRYFPPERLIVGAHLTLFHALPGAHAQAVRALLEAAAQRAAPKARLVRLRALGRGFCVELEAPELVQLHARLQAQLRPWLTPQDHRRLWPHVTLQNKVTPERARAAQAEAQASFAPSTSWAVALQLWRYDAGPWAHVADFAFAAPAGAPG